MYQIIDIYNYIKYPNSIKSRGSRLPDKNLLPWYIWLDVVWLIGFVELLVEFMLRKSNGIFASIHIFGTIKIS